MRKTFSETYPSRSSIEGENARWLAAWKVRKLKAELLKAAQRAHNATEVKG